MIINSKKKISTDQNLIPPALTAKRIFNIALVPGLVSIISIVVLASVVRFGVPAVTNTIKTKTDSILAGALTNDITELKDKLDALNKDKSNLQNEYDNYYINNPLNVEVNDSILAELNDEISKLEGELKQLKDNQNSSADVLKKYRVEDLIKYLDSIRTDDITIVSLEDLVTHGYAGSSQLVYQNDVGETSFSLHGLAINPQSLSEFLLKLKKCEAIKDAKTLSIETHTVNENQNVYVFEVSITPKVLEEGEKNAQ